MTAPHISEAVAAALIADGWQESHGEYRKRFAGIAPAGRMAPDGARIVTLRIDASGRWLERLDGWNVARDCDLRNYDGRPRSAIAYVMGGLPA